MKRVVASLTVLAFAGCSFLAVNGPEIAPGTMPGPGESIDCTDSRLVPIVDIVVATVLLLGGIGALIEAQSGSAGSRHSGEAALALVPTGILFAISAVVGFGRVGDCKNAHEIYMR